MQRGLRTIVRFHKQVSAAGIFAGQKKINYFVDRCSNDCYKRGITNTGKEML
tara:strand:+ start:13 stop:168 length:156 start_codon:yes stop_codon:yes gene_type:complete